MLTGLDLGAMVRFHDERGAEATISLAQVDDPSAFGVVPTQVDGSVIAFVEKPPPGKAPSNWINAGTYVLEPQFFDRIPPRLNVSVERETFPRMLAEPGLLFGFQSDAYWLDIGTPEKYLEAHADVLAGRVGLPPVPDAVALREGIWVQPGATIDAEAVLEAPVLVGAGATDRSACARVVVSARCRRRRRSRRGARRRGAARGCARVEGCERAPLGGRTGRGPRLRSRDR